MNVAGVNGVVLTKLDGTAKGGIAVAIAVRAEAADPLRGRRRVDRRPRSRSTSTNTSTRCSKRNGKVRRSRLWVLCLMDLERRTSTSNQSCCTDLEYMNRALDLAERGRGTTSPNPMVGAVVVRRGRHDCRAGLSRARRRTARRGARARRGRRSGAGRVALLHAGALLPRRPHRALRRARRGRRHRARRRGHGRSRSPGRAAGASSSFGRRASTVAVGAGRARALRLNRAYFTFKTQAPAVRHHEGGDEPRQSGGGTSGRADRRSRSERLAAARACGARRGRRDRASVRRRCSWTIRC